MTPRSRTKVELEATGLSESQLDKLWLDSAPYRAITDEEFVGNALSGNDPEAARSVLYWLHVSIRDNKPMEATVREYSMRALDRYLRSKMTLGEAFGTERPKQGRPIRAGAKAAVAGLIRFLNEEHQFPLSDGSKRPSAFLVAATLMQKHWGITRSPTTLRDDYWNKRNKGESL